MILSVADLRRAVQTTLQQRLPVALHALSLHLADDVDHPFAMPEPRTWQRLADFTAMAERQSPAVVVTTPELRPRTRDADGDYDGYGRVRVFAVVRGRDFEETADRVAAYLAAIRITLLTDPGLGGLTRGVTWEAEAYTELDASADRTIGAGSVTVRYDTDLPGQLPSSLLPGDLQPITVTSTLVDVEPLEDS